MHAMSHQPVVQRREQDSEHRNADDPGGIRPQRPQQRRAQRKDDERGALVLGIEKRNRRAAGDELASSLDAQHATQRLPVNRDRDEIVAGRDLVYRAAESTKPSTSCRRATERLRHEAECAEAASAPAATATLPRPAQQVAERLQHARIRCRVALAAAFSTTSHGCRRGASALRAGRRLAGTVVEPALRVEHVTPATTTTAAAASSAKSEAG